MKKLSKAVSLLACAVWLTPRTGLARDAVEVNLNAAVREYCHVIRFPSGWQMPGLVPKFDLSGDYEFRVPGLLSTRFLVRGLEELSERHYTTNLYGVDLSDPRAVAQPAREEEWTAATVISLYRGRKDEGIRLPSRYPKYVELKGLRFVGSGDNWAGVHLSQDRAVLIMQSWSGKLGPGGSDVPLIFSPELGGRNHGKLIFDVYNANTGKKLVMITASFITVRPDEIFLKTAWVTERYFIVSLDERRERCLVCEFGQKR